MGGYERDRETKWQENSTKISSERNIEKKRHESDRNREGKRKTTVERLKRDRKTDGEKERKSRQICRKKCRLIGRSKRQKRVGRWTQKERKKKTRT